MDSVLSFDQFAHPSDFTGSNWNCAQFLTWLILLDLQDKGCGFEFDALQTGSQILALCSMALAKIGQGWHVADGEIVIFKGNVLERTETKSKVPKD